MPESQIKMLQAKVQQFPVFEQGDYLLELASIKLVERTPYGVKDNTTKENAFRFTFNNIDEKGVQRFDKSNTPIKFTVTTGTSYGSPNATLTKIINGITGHSKIPDSIVANMDLERLQLQRVRGLVSEDTNDAGETRNSIVSYKRLDGKMLDLNPFLLEPLENPFEAEGQTQEELPLDDTNDPFDDGAKVYEQSAVKPAKKGL